MCVVFPFQTKVAISDNSIKKRQEKTKKAATDLGAVEENFAEGEARHECLGLDAGHSLEKHLLDFRKKRQKDAGKKKNGLKTHNGALKFASLKLSVMKKLLTHTQKLGWGESS